MSSNVSKIMGMFVNMYERPIEAIVRELFCNAIDSHKEAGQTKPVEIKGPTLTNPMFTIRDYGIGMTEDFVHESYSSFGTSSKDDSDDAIGGFGLGGKSPFAYTDSFTLKCYDGTNVYIYNMTNTDDEITTDAVIPSTEPKGVEIIVPVQRNDTAVFESAIQKILRYFPEDAYTTNCHADFVIPLCKDWVCFDNQRWSFDYGDLICGNVRYQYDTEAVANALDSRIWNVYTNMYYMPRVNIGEVTIAPSRENVIMDDRTVRNIAKKIEIIVENATKDWLEDFDLNAPPGGESLIGHLDGMYRYKRDYIIEERRTYLSNLIGQYYDECSEIEQYQLHNTWGYPFSQFFGPEPDISKPFHDRFTHDDAGKIIYKKGRNGHYRTYHRSSYSGISQESFGIRYNTNIHRLVANAFVLVDMTGSTTLKTAFDAVDEHIKNDPTLAAKYPKFLDDHRYYVTYRPSEYEGLKELLQKAFCVDDDGCFKAKDLVPQVPKGSKPKRTYTQADLREVQVYRPFGGRNCTYVKRKDVETFSQPY
ncbi:MAG: hypothetical protein HRT61_23275, partial [Ekhidna sp.]|nr:hypothetical protein [Ekhidna sp.]